MLDGSRLEKIVQRFNQVKIMIVGDVMLDEYLIGNVTRISPEAPVPIVNITKERFVLGGAANVLNNAHSLGAISSIVGVIGADDYGKKFLSELEYKNIDQTGVVIDNERPTILKSRILSQGQQLLRLDWEKSSYISEEIENKIIEKYKEKIDTIDAIILSDYNKGLLTPYIAKKMIQIANEKNKLLLVDPKPQNFLNYKYATAITPNRKEVLDYLGLTSFQNEEHLTESMLKLKKELKLQQLILTRSEEGVSIYGEIYKRIPTVAREVFDVTGAGDTFISTITISLAAGATWEEALVIANIASGIVVGKIGTETVTPDEIITFYYDYFMKLTK